MKREIKKCKRCGHIWLPRKNTVAIKVCPRCKSPYWDKEKQGKIEREKEQKD